MSNLAGLQKRRTATVLAWQSRNNLPDRSRRTRAGSGTWRRLTTAWAISSVFGPVRPGWRPAMATMTFLERRLKSYRVGLDIRVRMAGADSTNTFLQYELAISHGRIGEALFRQREFDAAAKEFERAKGIFLSLVSADSRNVSWQYDLAVSHERLADVLIEQGKVDEAVVNFRASLKIRDSLMAADPNSVQRQIEVAWLQR